MHRFVFLFPLLLTLQQQSGVQQDQKDPVWALSSVSPASESLNRRDFHYRMRGMVRLLFFWVGKDGVGGGRVSFLESASEQDTWADGVEVLFGSEPKAVPGGHNRWGYARELAFWQRAEDGSISLQSTLFEGFMSKSDEESLGEVRKGDDSETSDPRLFEGAISQVDSTAADARLWRYWSASEDTYHDPARVGAAYWRAVESEEPDIQRDLSNRPKKYLRPYGFISAIRAFVSDALTAVESGSSLSPLKGKKHGYVHNAKLYSLQLRKTKIHRKFELSGGDSFRNVLELEMQTRNRESGSTHSFELYVATSGEARGVPLRIVDKPRWWLKIRLELEATDN